MKGIECPICHGRCDPGEMIGGVCLSGRGTTKDCTPR